MKDRNAVLITGGAGYIGSHAAHACVDAGRRVIVFDNLSTGVRKNVPENAEFVEGDLNDHESLKNTFEYFGISSVMHFAGSIVVPDSLERPNAYYRNNTVNSLNLIDFSIALDVRSVIFSSTAAVYAPVESGLLSETAALNPISPYGRSKLMTEQMLADAAQAYDFEYVALRYFNVAGADPAGRCGQSTPNATHLIKAACETALGLRPFLALFGDDYQTPDGTCVRDYIHVSDLAKAHLLALEHLEKGGMSRTFNCGYGVGISVRQVVDAVERVTGRPLPVRLESRRPGDAAFVVADSRRIKSELGWQPQLDDIDAIVSAALEWERSQLP